MIINFWPILLSSNTLEQDLFFKVGAVDEGEKRLASREADNCAGKYEEMK